MSQLIADNKDVACYFTTKHSWRGRYKRLFAVGTKGITTYNPTTLQITNQWPYGEFVGILADHKSKSSNEFVILLRKSGKKNDTMRFSCDHRDHLMTMTFKYCKQSSESYHKVKRFNARKHHWSDTKLPVLFEVAAGSLNLLDMASNVMLSSYNYQDIDGFTEVSDYPSGFAIIYRLKRLHLFSCPDAGEVIKACIEAARNMGVMLKQRKEAITFYQFENYRFGEYSEDLHITSLAEFNVQKLTHKVQDPIPRILCLSETCILERDPSTYAITTLSPLSEIYSLIRSSSNPQLFTVEYNSGRSKSYLSTGRDALLATILDGSRGSGNRNICIKMTPTDLGLRLGPLSVPVEEEVESIHLRFLSQPPTGNFMDAVLRFNNCIMYSGLQWAVKQDGFFSENKEKLINSAVAALLDNEGDQSTIPEQDLEAQFHAVRRLVASKAGFSAFTSMPRFRESLGLKVMKSLQRDSDAAIHAAIDTLVTLLCPMHDNYDLRQEQLNKASLLSSTKFLEALLDQFEARAFKGHGALVISALLDFFTFSLCAPHSETTEGKSFDQLLQLVADRGKCLFRLFQHSSTTIVKGAGLVMKAIIEEGDSETAANMQKLALSEGALPRHLHASLFTASMDIRMLTNQQLSQHLIGLWTAGHPPAMELLKRIFPAGLLMYLDSEEDVPENAKDLLHVRDNLKSAIDQTMKESKLRQLDRQLKQVERMVSKKAQVVMSHWRDRMGLQQQEQNQQKPIVLRKRRQRIKSEANWPLFYYQFRMDHSKPNLIWNHKTREELRDSLENEMRAFLVDKELGHVIDMAWNHTEFEVPYDCLSDEVKIGDYYLRLLLEEEFEDGIYIKKPYELFNDLYHRFLLTPKSSMKCMCLKAMTIVYGKCWEDIGPFNDTKYIVGMLERCTDLMERDRIILFLEKIIYHKRNMKEIIDAHGIRALVDLLSLAHLHTTRAHVPTQRNVIEASAEMLARAGEKEWYFGNKEKERLGPYSFQEMKDFWEDGILNAKSRCWAQGMEGWRPLHAVPQLKWTMMATGQAEINETDLAITILNILIRMCDNYPSRDENDAVVRPLPRVKRTLSEGVCLPHMVQLLLTFDPILVEKVAVLSLHVMDNNPTLSKIYLTGIFFFVLMYTGSNILPIAKLLKYLHLKQAFRSEDQSSNMMVQSILGALFPEAMIHYLENHGPEKFSEIFLGEFDTPEAIWSSEMRRYMIEKIASHIADFTPRVFCNVRAVYQYVPIPTISYPQLEEELFCNIYFLRHLCDEAQFPDWPIMNPVDLLRDVLVLWKKEVEKKAPNMSYEEACSVLRLPPEKAPFNESQIRKAYFRMAQKYHPDKNPEGRDIFEAVNKAYEFLCTKKRKVLDGPDPGNILLILKTQSILFKRYKEDLSPYKYAGYPALIKTVVAETNDEQLFSKPEPLLAEAAELAYHIVNCSALNAQELRRENGIEILQLSFSRCVSMLSQSSAVDDLAVRVCLHVIQCYSVSAQFDECRERFMNDPMIIKDISRVLYFKSLPKLCCVATECVSAFSMDTALQTQLYKVGILWHLLLVLFEYDFTLEEGGVEKSGNTNHQELANRLARLSINALACLGGYMAQDGLNPLVNKTLCTLITPYLTKQLGLGKYADTLKLLNCNTRNPHLVWNNETRIELTDFLKIQQTQMRSEDFDPSAGIDFVFSSFKKELIIGDIFVDVYNEQPTFPIENPQMFATKLIDYLGSQSEYIFSCIAMCKHQRQQSLDNNTQIHTSPVSDEKLQNCYAALQALYNVIKNVPGLESVCIGNFKLIVSLLQVDNAARMQVKALEVLLIVTGNRACVENISDSNVVTPLLLCLVSLPEGRVIVLDILYALVSNPNVVKQLLTKGGALYLMNLFCNGMEQDVRIKTAELCSKLLSDKLSGPKIRLVLCKFMPAIFMDAMKDSSEASIHMFEGNHENPELIWDDSSRSRVKNTVKDMVTELAQTHRDNPDALWQIPRDFVPLFSDDSRTELVVGGVFLRLFIAQPGWVLRNPREFTVAIMDKFTRLISSSSPDTVALEMVTQAICCLFAMQPSLAEHIPVLGHLPSVFQYMQCKNDGVHKACILVIHALSNNESCVHTFASTDCIKPMMQAMKSRPDQIGRACEALHQMFAKDQSPPLMKQVIQAGLVAYLLQLLDGNGLQGVENVASTKAQIVKSLKAMACSMDYGDQIQQELDNSRTWSAYKDQKHDLFISNSSVAGYLTAGPSVAGYLTAAPANLTANVPPSVNE